MQDESNSHIDQCMEVIFRSARTHKEFSQEPVSDSLLKKAYDDAKLGPTSANCSPLRVVFVKSTEAKEKLIECLSPGNEPKTRSAPITAIFAYDMYFYEKLPKLFPHVDARSWFAGKEEFIKETAFRNSSLQAAYYLIALRAYGLACGPMSGFNNAKLDESFFPENEYKSNFICNIGYPKAAAENSRDQRLEFDEACNIV